MSITTSHQPPTPFSWVRLRTLIGQSMSINPLLTIFGILIFITFVGTLLGIIFDPHVITGVPGWIKPAKFAISITIYSFTLLWLLSFVQRYKRLVAMIAGVTAIGLFIEMVIIIGQVIRGTTSHFNQTTPLNATLWYIMAASIVLVWIMALVTAVLLLIQRMSDPAFAWSLRLGILLSVVGMAVAFLMTGPSALQLAALHAGQQVKIIGAHSVGIADGGPGLPFIGWSTVGGDLRVAHFVGLHALQVLALVGWFLTLRRFASLGNGHRVALVLTFGLSYLSLIALLTWQALRAQSIIAPDALTLQVLAAIIGTTILAVLAIIIHARMKVELPMGTKNL